MNGTRLVLVSPWTKGVDCSLDDVSSVLTNLKRLSLRRFNDEHPSLSSLLPPDEASVAQSWWRYGWQRPYEFMRGVAEQRLNSQRPDEHSLPSAMKDLTAEQVEAALKRRSERRFRAEPVSQGGWLKLERFLRSVCSSRPRLRIYLVSQGIEGVPRAVYEVTPTGLVKRAPFSGKGRALGKATYGQRWIHGTGGIIFFCLEGPSSKSQRKMAAVGYIESLRDTARIAQSILIVLTVCGLGACVTPAFDEARVSSLLGLGEGGPEPIYLVKFGSPR